MDLFYILIDIYIDNLYIIYSYFIPHLFLFFFKNSLELETNLLHLGSENR